MGLSYTDERAAKELAEKEWDATRSSTREPAYKNLDPQRKALWDEQVIRFVGRFVAIRDRYTK